MQPPADGRPEDEPDPLKDVSTGIDPIQSLDHEQQALITKELLRQTPEYRVAWELELWKKQESARHRKRLERGEARMRSRLESAFAEQESARQAQFEQRLRAHEGLERRLQSRLAEVKSREDRLKDIEKELHRRQSELEADFKRKVEHSNQAIRLAREECAHKVNLMQMTVSESETRLESSKARCEELDLTVARLRDECVKLTHRLRSRPRQAPEPRKAVPQPQVPKKRPRAPSESEVRERLRLLEAKSLSDLEAREESHKAELSALAQRHAARVSRLVRRVVELKANLKVARAELRAERARRRSSERNKRRSDVESVSAAHRLGSGKKRTIVIPASALKTVFGKLPSSTAVEQRNRGGLIGDDDDVSTAPPSRRHSHVDGQAERTFEVLDDLRKQLEQVRSDITAGVKAEMQRQRSRGEDRRPPIRSRNPSRHLPPDEEEVVEDPPGNSSNEELVRSFEDRDDPLLGSPEQKKKKRPGTPPDLEPVDFDHDHELAMFPPIVEISRTRRPEPPPVVVGGGGEAQQHRDQIRKLIENKARLLATGNYSEDDEIIRRLDSKLAEFTGG